MRELNRDHHQVDSLTRRYWR